MLPQAARVKSRGAVEWMYADRATIITEEDTVDPKTGIVETHKVTASPAPCRLSYKRLAAATGDGIPVIAQSVTLYLAPEVSVPPGADIDIEHGGRVLHFKSAGAAAVYVSHQEVPLEIRGVHGG